MKVYFDNVNFSSVSGPNTFAHRLAHQLSLMGHVIADPDDCDVSLVFIEPTERLPKKPYVHRLDGIWFKPDEYETKNVNIKACYERADYVVFQSHFDCEMVTRRWGTPKTGSVITNGIDLTRVTNTRATLAELRQRYAKIFVCSSNWHPQKRLKSNIELFKHIRSTLEPYSCLLVMGANPDCMVADANIYYTGALPHELCLEIYSVADWMIHLAWLDHCPNVVVEALSQGCPVICSDTGGTQELVRGPGLIRHGLVVHESSSYNFELADYDNPPSIDITQVSHLPNVTVGDISRLDIKHAAKQYESVLEYVTNLGF